MIYSEIYARSALNKLKRKIPYRWDLNIYRGCEHACHYCYARYSHKYLGSGDFDENIYVKTNIVDVLSRELKSSTWRNEVINIGGVTDSYQPAEQHYQIMPQILRLMIEHKNPVIISTKSSLILRDFELIDELSRMTYVNVAVTITTVNEELRARIEPGSSSVRERFQILGKFRDSEASRGLHVMPILPFITDDLKGFEELFCRAQKSDVDYALCGTLYLLGRTREHFFSFMEREFPELVNAYRKLYTKGGTGSHYKTKLYRVVNTARNKFGLDGNYTRPMKEKMRDSH
ncbi:radical SAM protein [Acidobacteriota bacterium]